MKAPWTLKSHQSQATNHPLVAVWRVFDSEVHSYPILKTPFVNDSNGKHREWEPETLPWQVKHLMPLAEVWVEKSGRGCEEIQGGCSSLPKSSISSLNTPEDHFSASFISVDVKKGEDAQAGAQAHVSGTHTVIIWWLFIPYQMCSAFPSPHSHSSFAFLIVNPRPDFPGIAC